jgi:hypothetical protein
MAASLDGVRAKIDRAQEHVQQFNRHIIGGAFKLTPKALRATHERRVDNIDGRVVLTGDDLVFSVEADPPPIPLIFSILAAESVYHLRSALDHLVYQLILHKTKAPPRFNSAFPIVGKGRMVKKTWRSAVEEYEAQTGRLKQDLTADALRLLEDIQPLKRGAAYAEDPLWILQELNNTDKHRLILLAVQSVAEYRVKVTSRGKSVVVNFSPGQRYERGLEIGRTPFHDPPFDKAQVRAEGDLVLEIAFAKVCGRELVPVIPLLTQLCGYVRRVVDSFAPEFNR